MDNAVVAELSTNEIWMRSQFCGLNDDRVFFNNAAGSLRLKSVLELQNALTALPDYPDINGCEQSKTLFDAMTAGKEAVRFLINAPDNGEIIQDLSASRLLFSLSDAAVCAGQGSRLVTSELDHPAAIDGLKRLADRYDKELVIVPVDQRNHSVTADRILSCINGQTSLLMLTCTSNTTGAVLPYLDICKEIKSLYPDMFIILDGVQRLPHGRINLIDTGADALIIAPYKVFSARGSGLAWVSDRLNQAGKECLYGHEKNSWCLGSVDPVSFALMRCVGEYFFELGKRCGITLNNECLAADSKLNAVYSAQRYIEQREQALLLLMLEGSESVAGLRKNSNIRLWFDHEDISNRDFIVSFSGIRQSNEKLLEAFRKKGISLSLRRADSVYCGTLLKTYHADSLLRVSPMHFHSEEDILKFLNVVNQLVG